MQLALSLRHGRDRRPSTENQKSAAEAVSPFLVFVTLVGDRLDTGTPDINDLNVSDHDSICVVPGGSGGRKSDRQNEGKSNDFHGGTPWFG
jgi:hypothetical protein